MQVNFNGNYSTNLHRSLLLDIICLNENELINRIQTLASVNELIKGNSILYHVLKSPNDEDKKEKIVELLLEKGANPNLETEKCLSVCKSLKLAALLHKHHIKCTPEAR